ncbi:drug resistance transporter [Modestobacter italicus]|uniref:Drug resistance transporter n=1 Tax=Modestobacter italicus (strain DSM 44449 / CECT 9708 / BC 501) TaxID=2732864 RepID=I4EYG2_MODI5|nr:MFS transporter [Modestobacter marinus]CCH88425.1 drug resistance transporter [Modestobacter marinus]
MPDTIITPSPRTHAAPAAQSRRDNPWLTLVAVAFGLFMVGLDASVVAIANPYIGRDLDASLAELQWVTNSYLLALAVALILGGKLGDRFGRRTFFLVGLVGFTLTSVAIGLAGGIEAVIAFRALQGLFGALMMPNTLGLLRAVFPPKKFGMAVGIWAAVNSVATAAGPIVGGLLVEHVNWEAVFLINAPVGAVGLVVGLLVLPQSKDSTGHHRFDVVGVLLLAAAMVAIVYPVVQSESWGWGSLRTLGLLTLGVVLLGLFALLETRVAHPLLPMRLFRNASLSVGTAVTAINFFVLLGSIFYVMLYLQNVRGYSPVEAGVLTLPLSLTSMVASPLGAALNGRFGPRLAMTVGMLLQAGASFGLLALSPDSGHLSMWPAFVALGLGVGMVMAASSEAIVGNAPIRDGGVAGGLQATALQVGGALGTAVLISVLGSRIGSTLHQEYLTAGVPGDLADTLAGADGATAQGVAPIVAGVPAAVQRAVEQGAAEAFLSGAHTAALVTGALCLLGAALTWGLVRRGTTVVDVPVAH